MKPFKLSKLSYYIISFTWGILFNFIGLIVAGILYLIGYRPKRNIYGYVFIVGSNWGGINLGVFSIVDKESESYNKIHEFGHSIQICIFGPFYIIFVAIPSLCRYFYRNYLYDIKKITNLPQYDYAWFEGQATMFGTRYIECVKK